MVLAIVAIAIWMGGMLALGAIAAPVVFRVVPAPSSADAMTVVFRRFDMVSMGCAALVLLTEVALAATRKPISVRDMARGGAALVAGGLSVWQGAVLSPTIEALHRVGAIRGLGPLGEQLDHAHHLAVTCGKIVTLLLIGVITLHVFASPQSAASKAVPSP